MKPADALDLGVIPGGNMTIEAAVTKLMWAMGRCDCPSQAAALFSENIAGEISQKVQA